MGWRSLLLVCVAGVASTCLAMEEKPPRVPADMARQHAGKRVEVVFLVQAAKHSVHRKTVYLDSTKNFQDEQNLGVAISEQGIAEFAQKGISAPADHFRDKTIRVTGVVTIEENRVYIKVDKADQLDLHDPATESRSALAK
jgi:hypothetical protein